MRSALGLSIFHNLKSITLVDLQIFGNLGIREKERERKRERKRENIYRERETEKQRNRDRESANKTNRKEVWFGFHIRYRGENIAKGLPPFSKN